MFHVRKRDPFDFGISITLSLACAFLLIFLSYTGGLAENFDHTIPFGTLTPEFKLVALQWIISHLSTGFVLFLVLRTNIKQHITGQIAASQLILHMALPSLLPFTVYSAGGPYISSAIGFGLVLTQVMAIMTVRKLSDFGTFILVINLVVAHRYVYDILVGFIPDFQQLF